MIKPIGLAMGAITVAGVAVAGLASRPAGAFQQAQQFQPPPTCTMPQDRRHSPGAMVDREGQIYQCVFVFGQNLTPSGVAWVKMERQILFTTKGAGQ